MKIIENCWDGLGAFDCQYGAELLFGETFTVYVSNWLFVPDDIAPLFSRINEAGCVGHCLLKFVGVSRVRTEVKIYSRIEDEVRWSEPVTVERLSSKKKIIEYDFSGTFKGFQSSVDFLVVADSFELHILDRDEPANE